MRGLDAATAETLLRDAMAELTAAEAEIVAITVRLNGAAGGDPVAFDQRTAQMLRRGLDFCFWSEAAHSPIGGVIYELWERSRPTSGALLAARQSAACDRLTVDLEAGTVRVGGLDDEATVREAVEAAGFDYGGLVEAPTTR